MIEKAALEAGFSAVGFCKTEELPPLFSCAAKKRVPAGTKSLIVGIFSYSGIVTGERNVAEYAALSDYHTVVGGILRKVSDRLSAVYPEEKFEPFVDNSPFDEVRAAYLAGLGVFGDNGLIINRDYGSRVFIGEIATTLWLPASEPLGRCAGCGECKRACPTGALSGEEKDMRSCLSSITQKKGELTDEEKALIVKGGLVWGCDRCINSCPMNAHCKKSPIAESFGEIDPFVTPENYEALMSKKAYGYRGKKVIERNLSVLYGKK